MTTTIGKARLLTLLLTFLFVLPSLASAWSGKLVDVAEGDTIAVLRGKKTTKVRLYGIDCPERRQTLGERAKQFTSDMVLGKVVEVGAITIDHYGRIIALAYEGKRCLNGELIRAGLAWVYTLYCNLPICRPWRELEKEVREAKRGLWKEPNPVPPWEFRRKRKK